LLQNLKTKKMKKVLLTAVAVFAFGFANAQSNEKGTMHINVMGGLTIGSGVDKFSAEGGDAAYDEKFKSTAGNYGVEFQYGLAESFSAGIGLELGSSVLTPKDLTAEDAFYSYDTTMSTFKVNLSGRYYIVNTDKFNFFAGPKVGFTSGKDKLSAVFGLGDLGIETTKYSGLNFGVNTGINYYFNDFVGGIFQVGYDSDMLKSKATVDNISYKRNLGGVKIMAGVAFKF
jgi:hypothetical protein